MPPECAILRCRLRYMYGDKSFGVRLPFHSYNDARMDSSLVVYFRRKESRLKLIILNHLIAGKGQLQAEVSQI
jgi:hypothetical protein